MDESKRYAAIEKIKHCLALSKSSNEFEAANALRQAQKLMEQYNIDEFDLEASEIKQAIENSESSKLPPQWETNLTVMIANAFDCKVVYYPRRGKNGDWYGRWMFIGMNPLIS